MATKTAVKTNLAVPVSFSIKSDVLEALTEYCGERNISRSWLMNKALENYLQECIEDKEDYETAARAWQKFTQGDGKTYSSDELRKEFGL